jgi:hypothetical protein
MAVWSYFLIDHKNKIMKQQRQFLCYRSLSCYILIATIPWILDMHYCFEMKPYYDSLPFIFQGMTLHVVWHIFAGLGTYYYIVLLVLVRSQTLYGSMTNLTFKLGLPVVEVVKTLPNETRVVQRGRSKSRITNDDTNSNRRNRSRSKSKTKTKTKTKTNHL